MTNPFHDPAGYALEGLHWGLGAVLVAEYFRRMKCGIFGPNEIPERSWSEAVWADAGYSLDAPAAMPAGGMTSFQVVADMDPLPEQMLTLRDE